MLPTQRDPGTNLRRSRRSSSRPLQRRIHHGGRRPPLALALLLSTLDLQRRRRRRRLVGRLLFIPPRPRLGRPVLALPLRVLPPHRRPHLFRRPLRTQQRVHRRHRRVPLLAGHAPARRPHPPRPQAARRVLRAVVPRRGQGLPAALYVQLLGAARADRRPDDEAARGLRQRAARDAVAPRTARRPRLPQRDRGRRLHRWLLHQAHLCRRRRHDRDDGDAQPPAQQAARAAVAGAVRGAADARDAAVRQVRRAAVDVPQHDDRAEHRPHEGVPVLRRRVVGDEAQQDGGAVPAQRLPPAHRGERAQDRHPLQRRPRRVRRRRRRRPDVPRLFANLLRGDERDLLLRHLGRARRAARHRARAAAVRARAPREGARGDHRRARAAARRRRRRPGVAAVPVTDGRRRVVAPRRDQARPRVHLADEGVLGPVDLGDARRGVRRRRPHRGRVPLHGAPAVWEGGGRLPREQRLPRPAVDLL